MASSKKNHVKSSENSGMTLQFTSVIYSSTIGGGDISRSAASSLGKGNKIKNTRGRASDKDIHLDTPREGETEEKKKKRMDGRENQRSVLEEFDQVLNGEFLVGDTFGAGKDAFGDDQLLRLDRADSLLDGPLADEPVSEKDAPTAHVNDDSKNTKSHIPTTLNLPSGRNAEGNVTERRRETRPRRRLRPPLDFISFNSKQIK